ncbi:MAG: peptidylprolyl isomerase [Clostridiales Family XIII bacterium]|jgi:peptidyl-prolyl cis-trans isomerase B (cyclophilin B)|nr:peptidylprolyl isomerase [Clostridiales Family XIII bacterium]
MMTKNGTGIRISAVAAVLLSLVMAFALAGCGGSGGAADESGSAANESSESSGNDTEDTKVADTKPVIEIIMQDGGKIDVELDPSAAPISVENFLKLVNDGFYNNLTFHRIIPDFMIQGGDPEGTGMGGADETIKGEFSSNGVDNPISHERGVISMARSQDPDSASSQFFITNADSTFLDGEYAAFGHVTSGMDVVDQISAVETAVGDAPVTPVVIERIVQIQ